RRVKQLETERAALKKETDQASAERLEKLERDLADLQERGAAMRAHWQQERDHIDVIRSVKSEIEEVKEQAALAERDGDLERAAELRYGRMVDLERRLEEENEKLAKIQTDRKMLKE